MQLGARRLRPLLAIPQPSPFKEGGVRYAPAIVQKSTCVRGRDLYVT